VNRNPIAIFDSGLGGLSVVRRIRELMPNEEIVYFGDTARVPYGIKSRRTVVNFALEDAGFLLQFEPKLVVVACNTASALAMDELERALPVPVVGVVKPGATSAVAAAGQKAILILGTEATVQSGAYAAAIAALAPSVEVIGQACPLFVPLVEEGRGSDDPIVRLTAETYLRPLAGGDVAAAVLGCTHYPLIRDAIAEVLGPEVTIIDSGSAAAHAVQHILARDSALSEFDGVASIRSFVSDNPARFRRIGSRFLNHEIEHVEFVEPERYIGGPAAAPRAH